MSDLINRQAALDALDTWDKFGCDPDGRLVRYDDDNHYVSYVHYDDMVHAIKNLPSEQPQRMKGRWIHDGYDIPHGVDWMHCSVCGRREPHVPAAITNFCPTCGSDMRGEDDEA